MVSNLGKMIDQKAIGKRIKEYRQKSGITQEELAERLNLSISYISSIERGESFPRFDNLISIINEIHASADQIFADVIDYTYQTKARMLSDQIKELPVKEQNRIFAVVETLINETKK